MVTFKHVGDFKKTELFLNRVKKIRFAGILEKYARAGVEALARATPIDSGETAQRWGYEIEEKEGRVSLHFTNDHINDDVNIAIILQYGHGTRQGGYVEGRDYINPAIAPIFDQIAEAAWKEVISK